MAQSSFLALGAGLVLAAAALSPQHPAQAQAPDPAAEAPASTAVYDLFSPEAHGRWLGSVVVVPPGATDAPEGFAPGTQHWLWRDGAPPSQAFILVESPFAELAAGGPDAWVSSHPAGADDATFRVSARPCVDCADAGVPAAWMSASAAGVQSWTASGAPMAAWAPPAGGSLLFTPQALPARQGTQVGQLR